MSFSDILSQLCSCVMKAKDILDDIQAMDAMDNENGAGKGNMDYDLLLKDLWSIRGRKQLVKDLPDGIVPTTFDEDDDPPEEDENGDDIPVQANGLFAGQDFERLQFKCQENGVLFVDPIFPPCPTSLSINGDADYKFENVEWIRASEMVDDPQFVVDGATRFDINQGELGDCWLLAAVANLTLHKKLFDYVVPSDQSFQGDFAGIFHFRFWRYGEWIDVVVDDYLPTRNGKLLFLKSDTGNEFWSALLEKAYAKLHGSYEALKGGTTCEAMVDFSGGCSEQFELRQSTQDAYDIMLKAYKHSSMMACSIGPDPHQTEARLSSGLIRGHAYSVTKVIKAEIDTGRKQGLFPLIRIRNPWGNEAEWNGAWSDGSEEWEYVPEEERQNIGLDFENDGEFYMSARDFLENWESVEICHLSPDAMDDEDLANGKMQWHSTLKEGAWIDGQSAGGCRNFIETFASNPQFKVTLRDSDDDDDELCTCIVSVMQKGSRKRKVNEGKGALTIGFIVYRLDAAATLPLDTDFFRYHASCARSKAFTNLREVSARFKLPPGEYVVVPSTFQPGEEGEFIIRIFSEKDADA